jgi:Lipase (class 3)
MSYFGSILKKTVAIFVTFFILYLATPKSIRTKFFESTSKYSAGFVHKLLFPGLKRSSDFLIYPSETIIDEFAETKKILFVFGGSNNTSKEAQEILTGIQFPDHTCLDTTSMPSLVFPLLEARTQKDYINKVKQCVLQFLVKYPEVSTIYIAGHSLGAAISIQLVLQLSEQYPQYHFEIALDRSFDRLINAAIYQHGLIAGCVLGSTLGLIWNFDSIDGLTTLMQRSNVKCILYQVTPDTVLGPSLLDNICKQSSVPDGWYIRHDFFPENLIDPDLHTKPYAAIINDLRCTKSAEFLPHAKSWTNLKRID